MPDASLVVLGPPATDTLAPAIAAAVTELVTRPPIEPVVDTRAYVCAHEPPSRFSQFRWTRKFLAPIVTFAVPPFRLTVPNVQAHLSAFS